MASFSQSLNQNFTRAIQDGDASFFVEAVAMIARSEPAYGEGLKFLRTSFISDPDLRVKWSSFKKEFESYLNTLENSNLLNKDLRSTLALMAFSARIKNPMIRGLIKDHFSFNLKLPFSKLPF